MSAHTPGPWTVAENNANIDSNFEYGTINSPEGLYVASIWKDVEAVRKHAKANARLIAAAPELLTSTRELIALLDEQLGPAINPVVMKALQAIRKAEGRSGAHDSHA